MCQLFGVFGLHIDVAGTPKLTARIPYYLQWDYPQHDRFLHRNGAYIHEMHKYLDESKSAKRLKRSKKAEYLLSKEISKETK